MGINKADKNHISGATKYEDYKVWLIVFHIACLGNKELPFSEIWNTGINCATRIMGLAFDNKITVLLELQATLLNI